MRGQRRSPRRGGSAGRCQPALVLVLAFGLLAAPAVSALRNECDLCPPDCPMHLQHSQNGSAAHLGCHHTANLGARAPQPDTPSGKPTMGCVSCGNHTLLAGTALPPMLLAARHPLLAYDPPWAARIPENALNSRGFEPPDTPPPIGASRVA